MDSHPIEISAVIPVFNEEENLPILVPQVIQVLNQIGKPYEIVLVDDGSKDQSRRILQEMATRHPQMRILIFRENCGLSAALVAGMREAKGKIIVTLDADLQNDPADIPRLLKHLEQYDMATGWRQKREDPWLQRIASRVANSVRNRLSGEQIHDSACTLRAF